MRRPNMLARSLARWPACLPALLVCWRLRELVSGEGELGVRGRGGCGGVPGSEDLR